MGKVEEDPNYLQFLPNYLPWHGHVTALTVAPQHRRLGLAKMLTGALERGSEAQDAWFVDLFVRAGNATAIGLYTGMGYEFPYRNPTEARFGRVLTSNRYSVYRRVLDYYNDDPTGKKSGEDAFDMRKPLARDKKKQYIRENGEDHHVNPEDIYHA